MDVCPICNQLIEATMMEEAKRIAQVPEGPGAPAGTGRFLTIRRLLCECGERIERIYENRPLAPVGQ
jgi:hypothetical protein